MCSFPHFSPTCFGMLIWNFAHDFLLMYYRSSSSVVTLHPSGSASVHHFSELASYMHWRLSWNFKFDFAFFNAFLLENRYIKKAFLKYSWRAYYALFAVLRYIYICHWALSFCHAKFCGDAFSRKWLLKFLFFVIFRRFPNQICHFRRSIWTAGCDIE